MSTIVSASTHCMTQTPRYADHRDHIMSMIEAAVAAVDPYLSTRDALEIEGNRLTAADQTFDLGSGRLFIIAVGKAAVPMATAAAEILADALYAGVAVTKAGQSESVPHPQVQTLFAAHPVSDERSVEAAESVQGLLAQTTAADFVLFLISGGASALCTLPMVPLAAWQTLSQALLASGCSIQEFNTVRKQLDRVKGGGLARMALPARFATLVLSDVIGSPISMIGSGPTVPNPQTAADALAILNKYRIEHRPVIEALNRFVDHSSQSFKAPYAFVGDLDIAAQAALRQAETLHFKASVGDTTLTGEAREVGKQAAELVQGLEPGSCLILGGETTVTLTGNGIGGRNQELALAAALDIAEIPNVIIATYATDGDDGPTDAAGAIVTGYTAQQARSIGLEPAAYLARNDSFTFFNQLENHLIITGQTGTNVNDLLFLIKYRSE